MYKECHPRGLARIIILVIVATVLVATFVSVALINRHNLDKRNEDKLKNLQAVAQAEEVYFDRYGRYGSAEELFQAHLLDEISRDSGVKKMYNIYRNDVSDEWCAWVEMENQNQKYLSITKNGQKSLLLMPIDLSTCQN